MKNKNVFSNKIVSGFADARIGAYSFDFLGFIRRLFLKQKVVVSWFDFGVVSFSPLL